MIEVTTLKELDEIIGNLKENEIIQVEIDEGDYDDRE